MGILALFTVSGIQRYIFGSNRLKDNLGASELLRWVLDEGLECAISGLPGHERLYSAGGNAAYLFEDEEIAIETIKKWSRMLLEEAPGLQYVATYEKIHQEGLAYTYDKALKKLETLKDAGPFGAPFMALPVVKECNNTGLAACHIEQYPEKLFLSNEAKCKRCRSQDAISRMGKDFHEALEGGWRFVDDFRDAEESHIAVVHADGDGIGEKLKRVTESGCDDETFKTYIRDFSSSLSSKADAAYKATIKKLRDTMEGNEEYKKWDKRLPIRPIVYGGDDITFITLGNLGIALAVEYLKAFSSEGGVKVCGAEEPVSACAGVAIVPAKFPFARAYSLSEDLCKSAKQRRRKKEEGGSWIDFQLILDEASGDLETLRSYLYAHREEKRLYWRPYKVDGDGYYSWGKFEAAWQTFTMWPRNRVKTMIEALAEGEAATQSLLKQYESRGFYLPDLDIGISSLEGWYGESTPYFDPLEIIDFYKPLSKLKGGTEDERSQSKDTP